MSVTVVDQMADWRVAAACSAADADLFFPDPDASDAHIAEAKAVCVGCPVREVCLDDALRRNDRDAICGGFTPAEREQLLSVRPEGELSPFQSRRIDNASSRGIATMRGADLLVWLVKREMPVEEAAARLQATRRAVYQAFRMLVPAAGERATAPSAVERILEESSLTLRELERIGRSHEQIARTMNTSQNVVSACLRVLAQRDAALPRVSRKGAEDAVKRLQAAETRVRRESGAGLTVGDVIEMAGREIRARHDGEGVPLRQIALDLGINRESVRRAYQQMTTMRSKSLTQNDMRSAA
ncbi:WhiB family transcriptional regulator [Streptomyces sp. NPDC058008]|uniref:WhiB family transcriptional regulator n=1 Tax=Streptomyces sp. NPDC058008 TaxID=3346303 RepID=UPI0036EBA38D